MSAATALPLRTAEDFLALPDDGVERWLIRGELREKRDTDMTQRNKPHSITEARITGHLFMWLRQHPQPRGEIVCGEAGCILRRDPDTVSAGLDVAVISAVQASARSRETTMIDGPTLLIAEVLSPNDTQEQIAERVDEYLACGVPVVWIVNPLFRTVTVHRPNVDAIALDSRATLNGEPELHGFSCPVAEFFR